jgi:hypothetical protein
MSFMFALTQLLESIGCGCVTRPIHMLLAYMQAYSDQCGWDYIAQKGEVPDWWAREQSTEVRAQLAARIREWRA